MTSEHQIASSELPNVLMKGLQPSPVDSTNREADDESIEQSEDEVNVQRNVVSTGVAFGPDGMTWLEGEWRILNIFCTGNLR